MRYIGCDSRLDWPSAELAALISTGALPKGKALDLGCGNGSEALLLAKFGWNVVGVDSDKKAFRDANRRRGELSSTEQRRVKFFHADAFAFVRYRRPPSSFDLVVERLLYMNLESDDERLQFFRTCAHALRPGGLLIMRLRHEPSDWDVSGNPSDDLLEDEEILGKYFIAMGPEVCFAGLATNPMNPVAFEKGLTVDALTLSIRAFKRNKRKLPAEAGEKA